MAPKPPWSDLPPELISTIASSLTSNPLDIFSFRSVCNSWHGSSPTISSSSLLNPLLPLASPSPPHILGHRSCFNKWRVLTVTVIYSLKPPVPDSLSTPDNWVVFLDEWNPGKLIIRQPFDRESYSMSINFPKALNLFEFHATELGRFYNHTVVDYPSANIPKPNCWSGDATKIIILSDMSAAVLLSDEGRIGLMRLGVDEEEVICGCLVGTQEWEVLHQGKGFRFDDIVEFKGRVMGVDRRGRVYEISLSSKAINLIVPGIGGGGGRRKRLVESLGELFLVVRCLVVEKMAGAAAFKVYEFPSVGKKKWVEIGGIGDRNFFFGVNFSFSAINEQLGGCFKGNCIIYKEKSFLNYDGGDDDDMMFRELRKSDLRIGVCHLDDASQISATGKYPGYSELLWPPASWIWPIDRSKRLGEVETAIDGILLKIPESLKAKFEELPMEGDTGTSEDLRRNFFREADKLKKMLIKMKHHDEELISMEKSQREFDMAYTYLLNHVQSSGPSTEQKLRCANLLQRAKDCGFDDPSKLKGKIRLFTGLILNLEESVTQHESLYIKYADLLKR